MLEIACFNASSAIAAAKAGADRIELCADYAAGGVTPPLSGLKDVRKAIDKPVNVMIRPRAGDFNYSDPEFALMKKEIGDYKEEASGFVFGILDSKGCVDDARNQELVQLAAPLPCTFHRALDQVPDLDEAMEQLLKCGFKSVLTSGGEANALAGAERVAQLEKKYRGKISIILGGGVRSTNIEALKKKTQGTWYHSAAITEAGETVDVEEVTALQKHLTKEL
ncbi:hypothetical protein BS50DRAFT_80114 [Corynespora cassiicola Philippines]|uniref:Copper homeostasis protein cutC homolog n=1 Tax=Corynespora cassiicola Philippines TaxID=1448308 RepID=A0A2T2NGZ3_CORCC|nr:hypothetical protein BS50DRAFT_80114 [Corynespora cassiicola Philippines]